LSGGRTVGGLALRVAVTTGLMVAAGRWAGEAARTGAPETRAARPAGDSGAAEGAPDAAAGMDLSFYGALSGARGAGAAARPAPSSLPPAGAEETGPTGAWVVQALATRDERLARRLIRRLAGRGLPATLVEGTDGRNAIWRVRVGRYRDRAGAEAVARRVRAHHGLEPWVLQESD
jgi:cell division septation protein DedD